MRRHARLLHSLSKTDYPTLAAKGTHVLGADSARKALETRLGRALLLGTKAKETAGAWTFSEPWAARALKPSRIARKAARAASPLIQGRARLVREEAEMAALVAAAGQRAFDRAKAAGKGDSAALKAGRDARYRASKKTLLTLRAEAVPVTADLVAPDLGGSPVL